MGADHGFHRSTRAATPVAVSGEGIYLFDADGRRFVDACGGAAVSCLGLKKMVDALGLEPRTR
jgi:adenosylmethionine-8-amino-7-oxononanoate aminotransferase